MGRDVDWTEVGDRVFTRRYAFYDQQIGLVLGDGEALVVDTRTTPGHAAELRADIRRITSAPVRIVVNTHWHSDHTFGNHSFRPCVIWGHDRCRNGLLATGDAQRRELMTSRPDLADDVATTVIDPPDATFADSATVEVGGRPVELRYLGRGHTDADIAIVVADADVLFAGDLLESGAPPYFGDGYPIDWPTTVERLLPLATGSVVPGHGAPGDRAFVEAQLADLRAVASIATRVHAGELSREAGLREMPYPAAAAIEPLDRALRQLRGELDGSGPVA